MRKLLCLAVLCYASPSRADPLSGDCSIECDPAPPTEALPLLSAGLIFVGLGTAISVGHSIVTGSPADRTLDYIPVVGPLAVVAHGGASPDWDAALVFAACNQIIGLLAISFTLPMLHEPDARVRAQLSPGGASLVVHY